MTDAGYRAAIDRLLSVLGDSSTSGQNSRAHRSLAYSGLPAPLRSRTYRGYERRWIVSTDSVTAYRITLPNGGTVAVRTAEATEDTVSAPESDAETRMRDSNTMGGPSYPTRGARLLGAFRVWSTMRYFFAYKALIGEDWNAVFRRALPEVEAAGDSLAYGRAIAELCTHLHDSHIWVASPALTAAYWAAPALVSLRMIRGQIVVTRRFEDSTTGAAHLELGDVVLSVDGRPVAERLRALALVTPASTPQARDRDGAERLLNGPDGTAISVTVRHPSGTTETVRVDRRMAYWTAKNRESLSGVITLMPGNVGYVDLGRLTPGFVDSVFARLAHARAIVFDMRGYPKGTAWVIAPHLAPHDSIVAARFAEPEVPSPDTSLTRTRQFPQYLPSYTGTMPRYHGRTVMLIDDRTQSQAEHTGLFFEAANGTRFVGTPTAGANGDVTWFVIPGGISITFSGHDVRHADGRQLARVGLVPDVRVEPTIAGIAAGRDEVLEAALRVAADLSP